MDSQYPGDGALEDLFVEQALDFGFPTGQFFDFGFAAFGPAENYAFGFLVGYIADFVGTQDTC